MYSKGKERMDFITESVDYCYQVMPFGLKNVGATYQHLMDKTFEDQIGRNMEVYVDEMMVKFNEAESYARDLEEVFAQIQKHNM